MSTVASTPARSQSEPLREQQTLILAVTLNGAPSPLLWQFELLPDGTLATSAERLRLLGFDLALLGVAEEQPLVRLSDLSGIRYRYFENTQSVEIDAVDTALVPVVLDRSSAPRPIDPEEIERNFGALLNYSVFGDVTEQAATVSVQYEARVLSRWGYLTTSGYGGATSHAADEIDHVRLDTFWRYVDARSAIAYSAGDVVSEGGELGSIYRLGGIQVRRDFDSRPDLVTTALPILNGTAGVPSIVDLYINGMRYYTGEIGRGPFQFRSLPNIGGGANATVVLTDAGGHETRLVQRIYFAPELLPRGMLDFSVEAGFPRLYYSIRSNDYLDNLAGSGSARYGLTDWLTVKGHAEGMTDFANGSLGATVRIGGFGTVTGGFAASWFDGTVDTKYQIDAEARILGIDLYAGIERADAGYQDVVRRTDFRARIGRANAPGAPIPIPRSGTVGEPTLLAFSSKTDRAGASFTVFDTGLSFNYTRIRLPRENVRIASASLTRTLFGRVSLWANGFKEFDDRDDYGAYIGISLQLGKGVNASSSYARTNEHSSVSARAWRDPDGSEGSWGWTLDATEPISGDVPAYRAARVRYLARFARLEAGVEQGRGGVRGTALIEGSIVAMGGGVFVSPRIDESFAIVEGAGAHTPVMSNTRHVTTTDRSGRALVPYLASYQENLVSIDPSELAVDLRPARTDVVVIPGDKAGVILNFGVERIAAAIVILVDASGAPLPVGSVVTLEGGEEPAVVGFDGRTYLTGLAARNRITVQREGAANCTASFDFAPVEGEQVLIGPLTCQ